jgi:hypothetical protein
MKIAEAVDKGWMDGRFRNVISMLEAMAGSISGALLHLSSSV